MNENRLNSLMVKGIRENLKLHAIKIADRFNPGIPDIYIQNGVWIENKYVKGKAIRRINLYKKLSNFQISMCNSLFASGDFVFFGCLFDYPGERYYISVPWQDFYLHPNKERWEITDTREYGIYIDRLDSEHLIPPYLLPNSDQHPPIDLRMYNTMVRVERAKGLKSSKPGDKGWKRRMIASETTWKHKRRLKDPSKERP